MIILGGGAIQPSLSWQSIELPVEAFGIVVQFDGTSDWNQVKSRLLVRRSFVYTNTKMWDIDYTLYPHQDSPVLLFQSLPPSMYSNISSSFLDILKLYKYKSYSYEEPNWKITLLAIV